MSTDQPTGPTPEDQPESTPQAGPDNGPAPATDAQPDAHSEHPHQSGHGERASAEPGGMDEFDAIVADLDDVEAEADAPTAQATGASVSEHEQLAAERLEDLRRLQAEYVNYKKRVDRDREVIKASAVNGVVESLIPVLDDIHMARQHGDLSEGPFAAIAEKLESILAKQGIERFGAPGEGFDPNVHEALMNVPWDASNEALPKDATSTVVAQVLQPGYRSGERIVRAARVAVSEPE